MRIKILLMAVVLTGLLFSLSASAQDCWTDPITTDPERVTVDIGLTNLDYIRSIPKFDSNLGELISVKLTTQAGGAARIDVDSEDPQTQMWRLIARGGVTITLPNGHEEQAQFGTPVDGVLVETAPDDEEGVWNADFAGDDWKYVEYGTLDDPYWADEVPFVYTAADPEFSQFKGNPGEILEILIHTFGNSAAIGETSATKEERSYAYAGGWVEVEYTYCPPPELACIYGSKVGCEDEPLSGWTITLTKPDGSTVTDVTDADGQYSFCELPPGSYKVCEETRDGWYPVGLTCHDVILDGEDRFVPAFKNTEHFCISGHKFDKTGNGLSGWTINLKDASGAVIDSTTTGDGGYYEFCDLASGSYQVCEVMQTGWTNVGPLCISVDLFCDDSTDNDFTNEPSSPCVVPCAPRCPWYIKNELYTANCDEIKEVDASKGVLANEASESVIVDPESITIDPKYGTIEVFEDGSFIYDPTEATSLRNGLYVVFKYNANNGLCDAKYPGTAKIAIRC